MRIGKTANFQNVLRAFGEFFVDADVFLEDCCSVELGLGPVADFDVTSLCKRGDNLRRDAVDLPWIQSHSRGTVGAERVTCQARSRLSLSFSRRCAPSLFFSTSWPERRWLSPPTATSSMRGLRVRQSRGVR